MSGMRGEVVVVTGGSSGIGLAVAEEFARREARVVVVARDGARAREVAASLPGEARAIAANVGSVESIAAMMEDVRRTEGRIDVLVNSAGRFEVGPAEAAGAELAAELIEVNYLGAVRTIHAALPLLRQGRRRSIVTLSSIAGKLAPPFFAAYSGSKFALHGLSLIHI